MIGSPKKKKDAEEPDPKRLDIIEKKGFKDRVQKYANEKGEQEFKNWVFDLRKVSESLPGFHAFLGWLCEFSGDVTSDVLKAKEAEVN